MKITKKKQPKKREIERKCRGMDETYKKICRIQKIISSKLKDEPTIIYKEDDEYVFIDKNGKEITREEYDEICENPIQSWNRRKNKRNKTS